ncbi:MAG: AAA family ATPase [Akkermansiaceae bacterium]|jgi:DNA repair exonuclease SbcCD ATPase subunit|nr:AAA family ATPase [Akkermansiaceae bacterium]
MRLISLTVRHYRVHREVRVDFDSCRTLIGGPNESGKSTLVEAAHRALFLRAKTGGMIQKEMVSTRHLGDPEVLLVFEAAGKFWELEKRFAATKGATRLSQRGGGNFRDEEAETKLAEILKSETAGGRGAAGLLPDLWSHLWVWQGSSGDDPSAHTSSHKSRLVQHLQQQGVATLLQSAADQRVASRIAERHAALFTAGGKPKAGSSPEVARLRLEAAAATLEKAREAADRLAHAAEDHARAERDRAEITAILPQLRQDRSSAETQLQQVARLRREEETQLQAHLGSSARLKELEGHDRTIHELHADLARRGAALQPADETLDQLTQAAEAARVASQQAELKHRAAAEEFQRARLLHDLASAHRLALEKSEAHARLSARAEEAKGIHAELSRLRSERGKLPEIEPPDLTRLRKLESQADQASAVLEAMATTVELLESTTPVMLDGRPLDAGDSRILTDAAELVTGDGTRLRIRPGGGTTLATARERADSAKGALQSALQALSLRDIEHAAAVLETRQTLSREIERLETRWKGLGGAELTAETDRALIELEAARADVRRRADFLGPATPPAPPDLTAAQQQLSAARDALDAAGSAETSSRQQAERLRSRQEIAQTTLQAHRDQTAAARQALRDLEAAIKAREEAHGDATRRAEALAAAREAEKAAAVALASTRQALADLHPELLQADLDRFTRSLAAQEQRLREAENLLLISRERLTLDGGTDPEAELRQAEEIHRSAAAHHATELRRARAIETLHQLFTASREAIDRALVQPLADRINGYLACLFGPGAEARVQLGESGIGDLELIRPGSPACPFAALSGGTREQCAAAVRLALAEILAADHDGCLPVIFDDAFAYSDPARIRSLQRMLDLAATRGLQIIVLTCTPADYSAFGAAELRLNPA